MKIYQFKIGHILQTRWAQLLLQGILGGIFLYAGFLKLSDPNAFAIQIEKYGILPATWLDPAAYLLPLVEILAGLIALLGLRGGAETIGLLLLVFLTALGHAWWSGLDVPCGCFSLEDKQHRFGIQLAIIRDLVMLVGVFFLLVLQRLAPH